MFPQGLQISDTLVSTIPLLSKERGSLFPELIIDFFTQPHKVVLIQIVIRLNRLKISNTQVPS